jgi:site-specific DNA-methyltransferase (adenine-specific)
MNQVLNEDCIEVMKRQLPESYQIVMCDPPYNIKKDFGNDSDNQTSNVYLQWCDEWITQGLRILRHDGTMFIYGFSETLALILSRIPMNINRRWLVWHYTNKTTPSLNFWQRSHESIIVLWKQTYHFNRDLVREPYTENYKKNLSGKTRAATPGRFGNQETTYNAHPLGALPRDVIKIPALAGGAGTSERVDHPTQKPLALCLKLLNSCYKEGNGPIFIPFGGSGSECVAAKNLNIPFTCTEINPTYVELIQRRLSDDEQES